MTEIYLDGANLAEILKYANDNQVRGFTTNPSLMAKSGVKNYLSFAKDILSEIKIKPVSFEVISTDKDSILREAEMISSWGDNVFVKIPAIFPDGSSPVDVVIEAVKRKIKVNLTAVFSAQQIIRGICWIGDAPSIISIFAGRISDASQDPLPLFLLARENKFSNQKILWASCREIWNIHQATEIGADIITVPAPMLEKYRELYDKDLEEFSQETSKMFYDDAKKSGLSLLEN